MIDKTQSTDFAAVVIIVSRHGLRIEAHCRNQPYKTV